MALVSVWRLPGLYAASSTAAPHPMLALAFCFAGLRFHDPRPSADYHHSGH